jgi:calcineurin-like phosphoesterase family protein
MVAWNRRLHGAIHLHGHTHNTLDSANKESGELRVDIGLDSELANYGLVSLEQVYKFMKDKINKNGFTDFEMYVENLTEKLGISY